MPCLLVENFSLLSLFSTLIIKLIPRCSVKEEGEADADPDAAEDQELLDEDEEVPQ